MSDGDPTAAIEVMRRAVIFQGIPEDALAVLAQLMRRERFAAGATICEAGEPADGVFVIAAGEISIRLPHQPTEVRTLGYASVFGEYGMFGDRLRSSTAVAASDAVLLSLDYQRFVEFLRAFPDSTIALLKVTVNRLLQKEKEDVLRR